MGVPLKLDLAEELLAARTDLCGLDVIRLLIHSTLGRHAQAWPDIDAALLRLELIDGDHLHLPDADADALEELALAETPDASFAHAYEAIQNVNSIEGLSIREAVAAVIYESETVGTSDEYFRALVRHAPSSQDRRRQTFDHETFAGQTFSNEVFRRTDLARAGEIRECIFEDCVFYDVALEDVVVADCAFLHCTFVNASLAGVEFRDCRATDLSILTPHFHEVSLVGCDWQCQASTLPANGLRRISGSALRGVTLYGLGEISELVINDSAIVGHLLGVAVSGRSAAEQFRDVDISQATVSDCRFWGVDVSSVRAPELTRQRTVWDWPTRAAELRAEYEALVGSTDEGAASHAAFMLSVLDEDARHCFAGIQQARYSPEFEPAGPS